MWGLFSRGEGVAYWRWDLKGLCQLESFRAEVMQITFNCQNSIVFNAWLSLSISSLVMSDKGPSISSSRRKVLRQFYRCSFEVKMQPFKNRAQTKIPEQHIIVVNKINQSFFLQTTYK